jgi:hypothetical protein
MKELKLSVLVVAGLGLFATAGLITQQNFSKALRIGIAFSVYVSILLLYIRRSSSENIPLFPFVIAGGFAEIASGWLRPDATGFIEIPMVAAATLLAVVHWLGLRGSLLLRRHIVR